MSLEGLRVNSGSLDDALKLKHLLYFGPVVFVALFFTLLGASVSYFKRQSTQLISYPMLIIIRIWSLLLLCLCILCEFFGDRVSLPHSTLTIALGVSGLILADSNIAQVIFHVSTTCSWFGIFDMYVRDNPTGLETKVAFRPAWALAFLIGISPVLRVHMGNYWQIKDPAYMSVGLILLLSYFWGVEFPSCALLESSGICDVMGQTPKRFSSAYFKYDYRVIGMILGVIFHLLNALLLLSFLADEEQQQQNNNNNSNSSNSDSPTTVLTEEVDTTSILDPVIYNKNNESLFPHPHPDTKSNNPTSILSPTHNVVNEKSVSSSPRGGATSNSKYSSTSTPSTPASVTPGRNNSIHTPQKNSPVTKINPATPMANTASTNAAILLPDKNTSKLDSNGIGTGLGLKGAIFDHHSNSSSSSSPSVKDSVVTIPDDCIEITEEEAIRIVERGLRKFKTMRAH